MRLKIRGTNSGIKADLPSIDNFLFRLQYCLLHFRTFANQYQIEVHELLVALGWASEWEVGRKVDAAGDCGFDAFLAQLEDQRISSTINPDNLRGITNPQGSLYYNLRNYQIKTLSILSLDQDLIQPYQGSEKIRLDKVLLHIQVG